MYNSPIDIIYGDMTKQIDDDIYRVVQNYSINVDKHELFRALQYDRNQYEKGYADGKADAMAELVRCKDCKYWEDGVNGCTEHIKFCTMGYYLISGKGYCSLGERKQQ